MDKPIFLPRKLLLAGIMIFALLGSSCNNEDNPIKYPYGSIPDTVTVAVTDLNSAYDDYNLDLYQLYTSSLLIFSSNRQSSGGEFDLVQGGLSFMWDQTNGAFGFGSTMTSDLFVSNLLSAANTEGDDFGPYRFFSTVDGYEYMLLSSENAAEGLDFYYLKNIPSLNGSVPNILGPFPATLLNTSSDDAYISFDLNQDTAYFSSNRSGNFNIYAIQRPAEMNISAWLNGTFTAATPVDSLNSTSNDKCPFVYKNVMVFASDKPGGMGGYDLYYAVYRHGKWSTPENFGPDVNTASDEYRPVIAILPNYTNYLLMFSSNRPGGKGGFDLYFRGVSIEAD
jgi:hypothetical protein